MSCNKKYKFRVYFSQLGDIIIESELSKDDLKSFKSLKDYEKYRIVDKEIMKQLNIEIEDGYIYTTDPCDKDADSWSTVNNFVEDLIKEGLARIPKRP